MRRRKNPMHGVFHPARGVILSACRVFSSAHGVFQSAHGVESSACGAFGSACRVKSSAHEVPGSACRAFQPEHAGRRMQGDTSACRNREGKRVGWRIVSSRDSRRSYANSSSEHSGRGSTPSPLVGEGPLRAAKQGEGSALPVGGASAPTVKTGEASGLKPLPQVLQGYAAGDAAPTWTTLSPRGRGTASRSEAEPAPAKAGGEGSAFDFEKGKCKAKARSLRSRPLSCPSGILSHKGRGRRS